MGPCGEARSSLTTDQSRRTMTEPTRRALLTGIAALSVAGTASTAQEGRAPKPFDFKEVERRAEELAKVAASIRIGDPADAATQLGPVISERARQRILGHVDAAVAAQEQRRLEPPLHLKARR